MTLPGLSVSSRVSEETQLRSQAVTQFELYAMEQGLVDPHLSNSGVPVTHQTTPLTLLDLFEQQWKRTPEKKAVAYQGNYLTYSDLECRSNQLANYLRARGIGQGAFVAICIRRSLEMMVGLLGILKAGAAYVPLDPEYPDERTRFVLQDSSAKFVVSESELRTRFDVDGNEVLCLDSHWADISQHSVEGPATSVKPDDLAYVIYTSGSTGRPKGVMIPHQALGNLLLSMALEPGLDGTDVLLAVTTLSFDISALELYLPLTVGALVVVAPTEVARDPIELQALMDQCGATVMQGTPSTWRMLVESGWAGRRTLKALAGGEALTRALADQLLDRVGSLWNMYGPTETTIWSMAERVSREQEPVTIGHPIANTSIYVVDENGDLVAGEGIGELLIGGIGLAVGYWNRPRLTADSFIPNRFDDSGSRLYRTGDEVRRRPDGRITFLGRKDGQVKIRGHRVELQEVEILLRQHALVRDCVVSGWDIDGTGPQLVAHFVPSDPSVAPKPVELRTFLQRSLPEYMLPSVFLPITAIPLTPNGKVDRRSLTVPKKEAPAAARQGETYANHAEKVIARIYKKLLGAESIASEDDFFELGGHSLLAVRLVSELEKAFGRTVPLGDIFRTPSVAGLASVLMEQEAAASSSMVAIQASGTLPPFFCVHSQTSNVLNFRALANLLGPDQPFYGLEPRGLDGKNDPYYRIEDMAAHYIDEIRRVQSEGPYHIGGVCLGGVIALEMAQQLHAGGHEVALVALIDSHFPALPSHFQRIQKHGMFLWRVDRLIGELLARSPFEAIRHGPARIFEYMRRRTKSRANPAALAKVISANISAEYNYVPKSYPGPLVLFWCSGWAFRAYQDTRLAWSEVAEGGLEVHVVPGNHITMMEPPNVEIVAAKLSKCLEKSRHSASKLRMPATQG